MLQIQDVKKAFHNHKALKGVSFNVPEGIIFGLLGPNGAGKTTLIRIITGIFFPDEGQVVMEGAPIQGLRYEGLGYLPEERGLYKKMKVGPQLVYLTELKGIPHKEAKEKVIAWMRKFDMLSWWNKKIDELSKGMQQKVQFIATVAPEPKLIILDEPFTGLDPVNTNLIKDEIRRLRNQGVSIIFSTHRMEQVEEICEHIVLINDGQKILDGEVARVKEDFKKQHYRVRYQGALPADFSHSLDVIADEPGELVVKLPDDNSAILLRALADAHVQVKSFEEVLPTLNEIFIQLVTDENHA